MKHCLVFASLISPSKMILFEKKYQTIDTVFHHQMKHLEVRQKYSAARRIFNSLLGVSSGDETLHLMIDILLNTRNNGCSLKLPKTKLEFGRRSFAFQGALVYNTLPRHLRTVNSRFLFKSNLTQFFQ